MAAYGMDWILYFSGGHMQNLLCSPSDPIFWAHHSFIDMVWEKFRQESQVTPIDEGKSQVSSMNLDYQAEGTVKHIYL